MSDHPSPTIFISSTTSDLKAARALVHALALEGVSVWHDSKIHAGDRWMADVEDALSSASTYVLLVGPDYQSSRWANFESGVAVGRATQDKDVALIPVVMPGATWADVPTPLRQWNGIDGSHSTPEELAKQLGDILKQQGRNVEIGLPTG